MKAETALQGLELIQEPEGGSTSSIARDEWFQKAPLVRLSCPTDLSARALHADRISPARWAGPCLSVLKTAHQISGRARRHFRQNPAPRVAVWILYSAVSAVMYRTDPSSPHATLEAGTSSSMLPRCSPAGEKMCTPPGPAAKR